MSNAAHEAITFGRHYPGVLQSHAGDRFVPATLIFEERLGAQLEVVFMTRDDLGDFPIQREWFDANRTNIPRNLNFYGKELRLGLYGTRMLEVNPGNYVTVGTFTAENVVFRDRDVSLNEPLRVTEFQSRLDGLGELTRLRASEVEHERDNDGRVHALHITIRSPQSLVWHQGDAEVSISVHWRGSPGNEDVHVTESVILVTKFEEPRSINEHLNEHDKVRTLLSVLMDGPALYRGHAVRDSTVTDRYITGEPFDNPLVNLLSRRTLAEHGAPAAHKTIWLELTAFGRQVAPADFANWDKTFTPEVERALSSFLELMSRNAHSVADRIVNTGIAIEKFGRLLAPVDGERWSYRGSKTTYNTFAYRCVMTVGADWSTIADSPQGVAAAIRWAYTSSKHPAETPPDPREEYLISRLMMAVMRLVIVRRADSVGDLANSYVESWQFRQLGESLFEHARVRIDDSGHFYSTEEPTELTAQR